MPTLPELEAVMLQLTQADTAVIKAAEAQLKIFMKTTECVGLFLTAIQTSQHVIVRQMCCILLRKRINTLWIKLSPDIQAQVKVMVIQCVAIEPEKLVRRAIVNLISAISKHQIPGGQWNELLAFISECAANQQSEVARVVAMQLLHALTETVGEHLKAFYGHLKGLFLTGLSDPVGAVRVVALQASAKLVEFLGSEAEVLSFRELIPPMLAVIRQCLADGDEDSVVEVLDVFGDLVQSPQPVVTPYVAEMIQLLLEVVTNDGFDNGTRHAAGLVISNIVVAKPKTVSKKGLTPSIIAAMMHLCAADEDAGGEGFADLGDEEDEEDEDDGPGRIAQSCLDQCALNLPSKYVFRPTVEAALQYLTSANPAHRKAGCVALAVISEGSTDPMLEQLSTLLPRVLNAAKDPDPKVRRSRARLRAARARLLTRCSLRRCAWRPASAWASGRSTCSLTSWTTTRRCCPWSSHCWTTRPSACRPPRATYWSASASTWRRRRWCPTSSRWWRSWRTCW